MGKLYRAYSIKDVIDGRKNITVFWVCIRTAPTAPYEDLIEKYGSLENEKKAYSESLVKELFTGAEAEKLAEYLNAVQSLECDLKEVEIPLNSVALEKGNIFTPFTKISEGAGLYHLTLEEGGNDSLEMEVRGYYDLWEHDSETQADSPELKNAIDELLEEMGEEQ